MAELLTDDIIIEKLEADGFMEEPDRDISTDSHDHKNLYFEQDVYYYIDANQFAQDLLDSITNGGHAWCDPSIWEDILYEFDDELSQWWSDEWDDLFNEAKDELIDTGEYTIIEHDE